MRTTHRTRWTHLAALCGPFAAVALTRFVLQPAPSAAHAGPPPVTAADPMPKSYSALNALHAQAAEEIRTLQRAKARSPMDHGSASATPDAPTPSLADPFDGLSLRSVVGNAHGGLATINGSVYRPGDTIRPGLVLVSIDARSATVEVRAADGSTRTIARTRRK